MRKVLRLMKPETDADFSLDKLAVFLLEDGDIAQFRAREIEEAKEIEGGYLVADDYDGQSYELTPEQYEAAKAHLGISA